MSKRMKKQGRKRQRADERRLRKHGTSLDQTIRREREKNAKRYGWIGGF